MFQIDEQLSVITPPFISPYTAKTTHWNCPPVFLPLFLARKPTNPGSKKVKKTTLIMIIFRLITSLKESLPRLCFFPVAIAYAGVRNLAMVQRRQIHRGLDEVQSVRLRFLVASCAIPGWKCRFFERSLRMSWCFAGSTSQFAGLASLVPSLCFRNFISCLLTSGVLV